MLVTHTYNVCFFGPTSCGVAWVNSDLFGWTESPSQVHVRCLCMMSWCTQFLAGFISSSISSNRHMREWNRISPAPLHDWRMLGTDGVHNARQSPRAANASRLLPPQHFTCGNQTSQDEIQSSLTSCPVVSWKCFILLNTEKRGTDGRQEQHWLLQRKCHHRRGKTAHFYIWYRSSISEWQMKR